MKRRQAVERGGMAAALGVACCVAPIVGALGLTLGLAAAAALFVGLLGAVVVGVIGTGWIVARRRSASSS